jgi:glycine cleavage system H lipoate-binding protein
VEAPRACHNAFDCTGCSFDRLVQRKLATNELLARSGDPTVGWRDPARYQKAGPTERPCRHMLTGLLPVKYCSRNFECATCPVDQMLEDAEPLQEPPRPRLENVAGFYWARGLYLSPGHLWVRVEYGGQVRLGIDDFAARLLGPPNRVDLPRLGAALTGGQRSSLALVRDGKEAALTSPLQGVVVAVNPVLESRPERVHEDPYGQGWLCLLQPSKLQSSLKRLRYDEEAFPWLEQEAEHLARLLAGEPAESVASAMATAEAQAGGGASASTTPAAAAAASEAPAEVAPLRLAATGGRALDDIVGQVPEARWETLVETFLHRNR